MRLGGIVMDRITGGEVDGVGLRARPDRATGDDEALLHAREVRV